MRKNLRENWIIIVLVLALAACIFAYYLLNKEPAPAASGSQTMDMAGMNMTGNPANRYTASFTTIPATIRANQDTVLAFKIFDASSGAEIKDYQVTMEKLMHLVIVDSPLRYFTHIHPVKNGSEFSITTRFPHDGTYRLYITFEPADGQEQQMAFSVHVGTGEPEAGTIAPDASLTKTFGNTTVALSTDDNSPFRALAMTNMAQVLKFHLTDAATGEPVTDLGPYLGSYGHLILINEKTYKYIHVHPVQSDAFLGGPDVKFLPMSMFGPVEAGVYRVFAEFNRDNKVFVSDFTVTVNP